MKVTVSRQELKALRIFVSEDETRRTLNGVMAEVVNGQKPVLVSTDGRMMVLMQGQCEQPENGGEGQMIISTPFIDAITALADQWVDEEDDECAVEIESDGTHGSAIIFTGTKVKQGAVMLVEGIIDGTYPKWQSFIPPANRPRNIQKIVLSAMYLGCMDKAVDALGMTTRGLIVTGAGPLEPIEITIEGCDYLHAILMPMRCTSKEDERARPSWLEAKGTK